MAVNRDLLTKFNLKVVKQESVILANELIATAQYDKSEAAKHEHGWLDDNGKNKWEKWTTYVQDKETTIWQAVLHVSTAANGERYLYDIDTIKKAEQSGTSDTSTATPILADKKIDFKPNSKERFSVSESDTISKKNRELARQNQKLTEQNERLKTTIDILKGEFKRSAGHKIADQSINRLVSRLKGQNKSTIESLSSRRARIEISPPH